MRNASIVLSLAALSLASTAAADPTTIVVGHPRLAALVEMPAPEPAGLAPAPERSEAPARETTIFGLPRNVGTGDRILRTIVGAGLAGVGVWGLSSGELSDTTSGVLLGVSVVPFATAATGYCPLYQVLGIERSF
jgi:hypothetical protein